MFALRTFIGERQYDKALGHEFQLINRETEYGAFCDFFEQTFGYGHLSDDDSASDNYTEACYCFVVTQDYLPIPLYKRQKNYIVTESGKTYANLTYK